MSSTSNDLILSSRDLVPAFFFASAACFCCCRSNSIYLSFSSRSFFARSRAANLPLSSSIFYF